MLLRRTILTILVLSATIAAAQARKPTAPAEDSQSGAAEKYHLDEIAKATDDVAWHQQMDSLATVEKIVYTGLPDVHAKDKDFGPQPMILYAYTFIPKGWEGKKKHPLVVFLHGGVHGSTLTGGPDNDGRLISELVQQGYAVISPEYRGSGGYGQPYERAMDYGARENDDALQARDWMLQRYSFLDPARVGLVGWSHGGMIALMNLLQHPEGYACAFAGVPVSDLAERMTYVTKKYRQEMAENIGKDVDEDKDAYLRRSPVFYAGQLSRPLLIDANTTDETVHIVEVRHLLSAFDAAHKQYKSHIYEQAPGGHFFNRIDTSLAVTSRQEVYAFLREYLKP
ncbi:peptidase S9 prolyl oligopeptidase (plasmid) [Granulicella tundricola MP5ACTX9]|uniref:Peptidase S9 prolyl oligopeptidase n=2 Tax=Granulicella TaxID=940557 RepID=E8X6F8_GRATM|nr:peptidase S9 prolyl oligopeptidase [Granulicella tundricola MP5ACTX9]